MSVSFSDRNVWYAVLGFSVAVRLATAPFTGNPFDLGIWMNTGSYVGFGRSPYDLHPHIGYPPLWALWCWVSYMFSNSIFPGNQFAYIFVIKSPILCADYVLISLLLQQCRQEAILDGRALSTLYLLNPYVLIVGVIWGMMDNLVGVLVITSLLLIKKRPSWSGILFALGVALKIYPILFLPFMVVFLARTQLRKIGRWITAFVTTSIVSILLPFLIFNWDLGGFIGVGIAQMARSPAAIAPVMLWSYLSDIGVTNLGPISLEAIQNQQLLRLVWIPAVALCIIIIFWKRKFDRSESTLMRECLLVYLIYLLTAPSVSEQLFELVLILTLFLGAIPPFRFSYASYITGSAIVLTFLSLHAPLTSLIFPIYTIDGTRLMELGKPFLPWLIVLFTIYLTVEIVKTAETISRMSGQTRLHPE
ncbi:MAG TPA: glycosyltransferase family 87 protein [Candidatus Bathyarchaeia archaeon]|nr:glycosyltransferase family 87 protein [Candidatus Bathyarchaeia archaeon]